MTKILSKSVAIIIALMTQSALASSDETAKYPAGDGTDLTMHIFLPEAKKQSGKAVIFYFGVVGGSVHQNSFFLSAWLSELKE